MGASNDNVKEIVKTDPVNVCGIKVFMGASTGNMLVDNKSTLQAIFKEAPCLVATHCEDEATIQNNIIRLRNIYRDDIPIHYHPQIRSDEACYISTSLAIELAENIIPAFTFCISQQHWKPRFSETIFLCRKRVSQPKSAFIIFGLMMRLTTQKEI